MALPPSSKYLQRANDPVDEVERDSINARLNAAFADGRISHDDYAVAMDQVFDAKVLGDLVPVIDKLPAAAVDVPAIVQQSGPPAGRVSESRSLLPVAIGATVVGVALLAILLVLVVVTFL